MKAVSTDLGQAINARTGPNIAYIYAILALIATAINIGAQDLMRRVYTGPFHLALSIALGTGAGLIVKYILDKRYVFCFKAKTPRHDGRVFMLYSAMGLVTTFIFWGFELGFDHFFQSTAMRYSGALIGLALGYLAKYHLDKRYVFL